MDMDVTYYILRQVSSGGRPIYACIVCVKLTFWRMGLRGVPYRIVGAAFSLTDAKRSDFVRLKIQYLNTMQ